MEEIINKVAEQSEGVLTEVYKDALSPSLQPIGQILSLFPRTLRLCFSGWEKWVVNREETLKATALAIKDKVNKLPEEKIVEPEPYVAIPAIQQLSYCFDSAELRELYANLLVSSMNIDTKWNVHPSFVDIIKQLTPDEAKFLKELPPTPQVLHPKVDMMFTFFEGHGENFLASNFTDVGLDRLDAPQNICSYIDNLARLGVIALSPYGRYIVGENTYTSLEKHPVLIKMKQKWAEANGSKVTFRHGYFYVTAFGANLIETCCKSV